MRSNFPTKDELSVMSILQLQHIDIAEKDEEEAVQEILTCKLSKIPPKINVKALHIPDIFNGEDEAKYQKIIDEKKEAARIKPLVDVKIEEAQAELQKVEEEIKIEAPIEPIAEANEIKTPWCQFCTSKGGRHKLDCTRTK